MDKVGGGEVNGKTVAPRSVLKCKSREQGARSVETALATASNALLVLAYPASYAPSPHPSCTNVAPLCPDGVNEDILEKSPLGTEASGVSADVGLQMSDEGGKKSTRMEDPPTSPWRGTTRSTVLYIIYADLAKRYRLSISARLSTTHGLAYHLQTEHSSVLLYTSAYKCVKHAVKNVSELSIRGLCSADV